MRIGEGFTIQPIPLKHSVENYGFLIEHPECGRVIFATDCESFPYNIKNVNHILLEANYSEDKIIDNLCDNEVLRSQYENHLSIDDCIDALKRNYSPSLQTIMLLHLSSQNSDSEGFKKQVQESLGFSNVVVADKGMEIPLNIEEF